MDLLQNNVEWNAYLRKAYVDQNFTQLCNLLIISLLFCFSIELKKLWKKIPWWIYIVLAKKYVYYWGYKKYCVIDVGQKVGLFK